MIRFFILFLFYSCFIYALEFKNRVYFLPNDSKKLYLDIDYLISNSKYSIDIAMYIDSYKPLAKLLKKSSKKGLDISIIFDEKKIKKDKKSKYNYLENSSIKRYIANKKMHLQMALSDNSIALICNLNWTKDSFSNNYELVYITNDKLLINSYQKIFKELKKDNLK